MKHRWPASHAARMSRTITALADDKSPRGRHTLVAFASAHIPRSLHIALRELYARTYTEAVTGQSPDDPIGWRADVRLGPVSSQALSLVDEAMPDMLDMPDVDILKLAFALHAAVRVALTDAMRAFAKVLAQDGEAFDPAQHALEKWELQLMGANVGGVVLARLLDVMGKVPGRSLDGARAIKAFTAGQAVVKFRDVYLASNDRLRQALAKLAVPDVALTSTLVGKNVRRELGYWANDVENIDNKKVQKLAALVQTRRIRTGRVLAAVAAGLGLTDDVKETLAVTCVPKRRWKDVKKLLGDLP